MEKRDLVKFLNDFFCQYGFKRKGNNWISDNGEIVKIVNLQKSNYSNSFYLNYGFIIKKLELTTNTHVDNRLASSNKEEQQRITDLLDLEKPIGLGQRLSELKEWLGIVTIKINSINNENDLFRELTGRSHLNDIPLVVKKHFGLA